MDCRYRYKITKRMEYLKRGRGETSCYNISKYKNETEKNSAIMLLIYLDVSEDCWPHRCDWVTDCWASVIQLVFISKQLYSMKKDARIMWEPEFLLLWILLWQHTKDMANFAILPQPVHLCSWKHECFLDTNILSLQSFIDHIRSIWNYYYEIILDLYTIFIWIKTQYFQLIIFNGFTTCRWVNKL